MVRIPDIIRSLTGRILRRARRSALAVQVLLAASLLLLAVMLPSDSLAARRFGLVIGNDDYADWPVLKKAVNDAKAVSEALESIGFDGVVTGTDLDRRAMNQYVAELADKVEPGDMVFVFYAGHGMAIRGSNYLLPVDTPLQGNDTLITGEAIAADSIVSAMQERGAATVFMVLDACRDNPFAGRGGSRRGVGGELGGSDVFVIYSAGFNQAALDRLGPDDENPNSIFTRSLVPLIKRQGISVQRLAKQLQGDVRKLANTVGSDQRPAYYDQLEGDLFLNGKPTGNDQEIAMVPVQPAKPVSTVPETECDRQVKDLLGYLEAIATDFWSAGSVDKERAEAACRAAVEAFPDETRFRVKYAHVLIQMDKGQEALAELQKAEAQGDLDASVYMALLYGGGAGIPADEKKAIAMIEAAADKGNVPALMGLAIVNLVDDPVTPNFKPDKAKGLAYLERAAAKGDVPVMRIAALYFKQKKDLATAEKWWRRAIDVGDDDAKIYSEMALAFEGADPPDLETALHWRRKAADLGDPAAIYGMAEAYREGKGLTADLEEATRLYKYAATLGHADALVALGNISLMNDPSSHLKEALDYFRRADELEGYVPYSAIGREFEEGMEGRAVDLKIAAQLYEQCAAKDDTYCIYLLTSLYLQDGEMRNTDKAIEWLKKGAALKDADSARRLAQLYEEEGPLQDAAEAKTWNALADKLAKQ